MTTHALMELAERVSALLTAHGDMEMWEERDAIAQALRTAAAEGGEVACHRWLRNGEPVGPWTEGVPSDRQHEAATACAQAADWKPQYAYLHPPTDSGAGRDGSCLVAAGTKMSNVLFNFKQRITLFSAQELALMDELQKEWDSAVRSQGDGETGDKERVDYMERTFSGMTNRERYLPVQMIWGKGANGRTLREACDKYMAREKDTAIAGAAGEKV